MPSYLDLAVLAIVLVLLVIVTLIAGTTRDRITETMQIHGVPVHVIDTAGLRDASDEVEKLGIERSWQAIADADAVLFLHDLSRADDPRAQADDDAPDADDPPLAGGQIPPEVAVMLPAIGRGHQQGDALADHLFRRVAEQTFAGRIEDLDMALGIDGDDAVRRHFRANHADRRTRAAQPYRR